MLEYCVVKLIPVLVYSIVLLYLYNSSSMSANFRRFPVFLKYPVDIKTSLKVKIKKDT